jgi:beta-phosphoglucomutase-like phosphatase (HAD superfamily)
MMGLDLSVEGFLFDNDGVIIDTERALVQINTDLLSEYGVSFDPDTRKYFIGKPDVAGLRVLIEKHGIEGLVSAEELSQKRSLLLDTLYSQHANFVPGFLDYYEGLRRNFSYIPVVVASGTDPEKYAMADKKLKLRDLFDGNVCLSRNSVVNHKPAPDIVVYAAGIIQVPVWKCAIWEDSPLGLASAYNAGVRKNIGYTGTLSREDLLEATNEALGRKLEEREEILFIDEFSEETLKKTILYLKKPIRI